MRNLVQVTMDAQDFMYLIHNAMQWAGEDWEAHIGNDRFLPRTPNELLGRHWEMAYWLGADYTAVFLARAYLASIGEDFQVVSDEADGEWMILTDYKAEI